MQNGVEPMSNAEQNTKSAEESYTLPMQETTHKRGPRRMNHHGCLIYKGEGRPYLAKWMVDGKLFYKSTGETDKRKAMVRQAKLGRTSKLKGICSAKKTTCR